MSKSNPLAVCFAVILFFTQTISAAVLFSTGPSADWVTANANFQRTTAKTTTEAGYTYTSAFSDTSALSPASGYTGTVFYGGYQFTSSAVDPGLSGKYIRNAYANSIDYIWLQAVTTAGEWSGSALSLHGVYIFKQENFSSAYTSGVLSVSNMSTTYNAYGASSGSTYDATGRFVVEIGGVYYVSESTFSLTGQVDTTVSFSSMSSQKWAVYDPSSSLDFNQNTATYSDLNLDGVTSVGVYFEDDAWTGSSSGASTFAVGISSFTVEGIAIPESQTIALFFCGVGVFLFQRFFQAAFKRSLII